MRLINLSDDIQIQRGLITPIIPLAEGINSKIQKFISSNNGTRDTDFFFFRLANYYA